MKLRLLCGKKMPMLIVHVRYHSCQESHPFFTPLIEHKKMPVKTNNVLVTYLRYLRVPKYIMPVVNQHGYQILDFEVF